MFNEDVLMGQTANNPPASWLLDNPLNLLYLIIGVFVLLVILGLINHYFAQRKYKADPQIAKWREELLKFVVEKSNNRQTEVKLRKFWRMHKIQGNRRYFVVKPLLDEGTLYVKEKAPPPRPTPAPGRTSSPLSETSYEMSNAADKQFFSWMQYVFTEAPGKVVLSDRDWERIRRGETTPHQIIMESGAYLQYFGNNGPANGAMAARDMRNVTQKNVSVNSADHLDKFHDLHLAMLTDARKAEEGDARIILRLAAELQDVLDSGKGAQDERLEPLMGRIKGASDLFSSLMTSTSQALTALNNMGAA